MSQAQFANLAGVSRKTVTQWKSKGFLVFNDDQMVEVEASIKILRDRGLGKFDDEVVAENPPDLPVTHAPDAEEEDGLDEAIRSVDAAVRAAMNNPDFELLTYSDATRMKENFLALQQKLNYEVKVGNLVDRFAVEADFTNRWAVERNAWEVWPSTVCGDIAAKLGVDQVKVRVILEAFVHEHLNARVQAVYDEVA